MKLRANLGEEGSRSTGTSKQKNSVAGIKLEQDDSIARAKGTKMREAEEG